MFSRNKAVVFQTFLYCSFLLPSSGWCSFLGLKRPQSIQLLGAASSTTGDVSDVDRVKSSTTGTDSQDMKPNAKSVEHSEETSLFGASEKTEQVKNDSALQVLAGNVAICLIESDKKRATGLDGSSTGWTSWIDEASAFVLQASVYGLCLSDGGSSDSSASQDGDNEDVARWIRWLQINPSPMIVELSDQFRDLVQEAIGDDAEQILSKIDTGLEDFLPRIACRIVSLPSGCILEKPLQSPPGAMVYGRLLSGGVTRFRLIGSGKKRRRAGERTVVVGNKVSSQEALSSEKPSWLQYGGPERNYQAVDMGHCLLLEVILLPSGLEAPLLDKNYSDDSEMCVTHLPCRIEDIFMFKEDAVEEDQEENATRMEASSVSDVRDLEDTFCTSVGGLRPQIDEIVRRVLDGRVVRGASDDASPSQVLDEVRREEMMGLVELGLEPVRGLLLYGPPGCGKTHLAREISTVLDARPPKIVAAPELLDRWVGGSESLIRALFEDAERELNMCGGDPTKSALHVVVIDECDAVFRKRSSGDGASESTRASAVNQILAKLDGVNGLGNVLLIGMTNRKELLDEALLRPGRLEVHVEIPLPDREGRRDILKIHFGPLRRRGRLSKPLCEAIDGKRAEEDSRSVRNKISSLLLKLRRRNGRHGPVEDDLRMRDLADSKWTGGFSGADLAGLVRSAGSFALDRSRAQGNGGIDNLFVTVRDVTKALDEIDK